MRMTLASLTILCSIALPAAASESDALAISAGVQARHAIWPRTDADPLQTLKAGAEMLPYRAPRSL